MQRKRIGFVLNIKHYIIILANLLLRMSRGKLIVALALETVEDNEVQKDLETRVESPMTLKYLGVVPCSSSSFDILNLSNSDNDADWDPTVIRKKRLRALSSSDESLTQSQQTYSSTRQINPVQSATRSAIAKRSKIDRVFGKPYIGFRKIEGKFQPCTAKPERIMRPRCHHTNKTSKGKNTFLCALINNDERMKIHSHFWRLTTWKEKISFVKALAI